MSKDTANWREETNAADYLLHQKKQGDLADRRPVVTADTLAGPGIGPTATRLTNLNDVLATFNGFFSCLEGTPHAPTPDAPFVGFVSSDAEIGGAQMFTNVESGVTYHRAFRRNPLDARTVYWTPWVPIS